jgi:APA family basic amino acid/polyamine antiporter
MVLIAALLGIITTWNTVLLASARILFTFGRSHILHPSLARIHPVTGAPTVAVLFTCLIASVGVLLGKRAIGPIVNLSATCFALAFLVTCAGALVARRTHPLVHRPYRMAGGVTTAYAAIAASLFMLFLSLYQPYLDAKGAFPLEWEVFIVWAILGALFWHYARRARRALSEADRRAAILGRPLVQQGDTA